jgi:hypothetical protein
MASEPFNIKKVPKREKIEILDMVGELPPFDIMDYDSDDEEALIKDVENLCRHSYTYQEWVQYLRKYMDMNKCSFFQNVDNIDTTSIKIHLHHSPITLMEIVVTILEKRKFYKESLLVEAIAKEVMYVHYCTMVGVIPLCETVHELVHNQFLFVPNTAVMGNYKWFIDEYSPFIPTQVRTKLDNIEQWTRFYNKEDNTNVIKAHYIYLDLGDNGIGYNLPKMEDMKAMVENKLSEIRANNYQVGPQQLVCWADPKLAYKQQHLNNL